MPVFDFSGASASKAEAKCTYTTFHSSHTKPSPEQPIMVLDNKERQWKHHSCGVFTNPVNRTAFDFKEEDGNHTADVVKIDSRFTSLLKWLGDSRINVRLSGTNREDGYAVYRIRETAFGGGTKLSAEDGFLQFMIERLLESNAPAEAEEDEEQEENGDEMKLTSIQSITDFMTCAGKTLPDNIRLWTRRNLAVARSSEVSQEERHHAQRALSIMLNIQWKNNYFEAIDPVEARRILDEELLWNGACETTYYRDDYPDQPYTYPSGLRTSSDRTCRYWQISDSLCSCKNPETSVDYAGHELN